MNRIYDVQREIEWKQHSDIRHWVKFFGFVLAVMRAWLKVPQARAKFVWTPKDVSFATFTQLESNVPGKTKHISAEIRHRKS